MVELQASRTAKHERSAHTSLQPWDTSMRRAIGALSVFSEIIMSLQACTIENKYSGNSLPGGVILNENICSQIQAVPLL